MGIETEVPAEHGDEVTVRCTYSRESDDDQIGYRIGFYVGLAELDGMPSDQQVAAEAIRVAHPYVRQLLMQLGLLMDNSTLTLPPAAPEFHPANISEVAAAGS
ncbi:hypothetical protein [Microbacterium allomyrinae]|uniref:Uncharacterized protein n=1 Tax=Microbacterium allomyrinae TaxID=2830666 RepID=A0A9X1LST6_9MICO|nr:hypothetical protein [Microbacterium allomyrinae]MCC2030890.1 hypothetical protein [Microbacterium allomyrinae]